eukprot:TRINITY_DN6759_c0_g1_i2.p1 TRINITY_DN6759_c0_g1~~TRINITY_DN6759_c0_g1_i2.p1  ORF type:complete len:256 (+),score=39.38 TRINITY_DN6759_c0_g1_i2:58-825(+)
MALLGRVFLAFLALSSRSADANDCMQKDRQLLFGCEGHREQYAEICCQVPQTWAEHRGFFDKQLKFFEQLESSGLSAGEITFYDSQCGIPLFVAPRGRSYEAFKKESVDHGWPSFREEEVVKENVIVEAGYNGELYSRCRTHLGHNLPDSEGNRHCINLMCIAGNVGNASLVIASPIPSPSPSAAPSPSPSAAPSPSPSAAPSPSPSAAPSPSSSQVPAPFHSPSPAEVAPSQSSKASRRLGCAAVALLPLGLLA